MLVQRNIRLMASGSQPKESTPGARWGMTYSLVKSSAEAQNAGSFLMSMLTRASTQRQRGIYKHLICFQIAVVKVKLLLMDVAVSRSRQPLATSDDSNES